MIWAIASALGLTGIGAALWLIPGGLPAVVRLIRSIPPLWLTIALCGAVAAFCWHGWAKDHARLTAKIAACQMGRKAENAAHGVTTKSLNDLQRATNEQNAAVETMRKDGVAAQARALAARDKARAESVSALALAERLQRGAKTAAACTTPAAIMEAEGL